jgi:tetratricopeptide (TPR) repeat protein
MKVPISAGSAPATCWARRHRVLAATIVAWSLAASATVAADEFDCGPLRNFNDFGPFDYRDPENFISTGADPMGRLKRVENVHFQDDMKALNLRMFSIERLAGEFTYTLRVFPNHPEALHAMSRLEKQAGGKLPQAAATIYTPRITADCFFDRAVRFRPEDPQVQFLRAIHLHDRGRLKEARSAYAEAGRLGLDTANFNYNYGLLLSDLKEWDAARELARKAYAGGFPLDGLRGRLAAAGYPL